MTWLEDEKTPRVYAVKVESDLGRQLDCRRFFGRCENRKTNLERCETHSPEFEAGGRQDKTDVVEFVE